jgi:hypothetical protein
MLPQTSFFLIFFARRLLELRLASIEAAAKEEEAVRYSQLRMLGGSFSRTFSGSWNKGTVDARFSTEDAASTVRTKTSNNLIVDSKHCRTNVRADA